MCIHICIYIYIYYIYTQISVLVVARLMLYIKDSVATTCQATSISWHGVLCSMA